MSLCACGCGQPAPISTQTSARRGWVKGQPKRFIHGHNSRTRPGYAEEERGFSSPCWIWQGGAWPTGYGRIRIDGRYQIVHRAFYESSKGPIPDGLHVDHLCRQRLCCNPDHLEAVTPTENIRRASKLTEDAAAVIRRRLDCGESVHAIAADYSVSPWTIYDVRNRTWQPAHDALHPPRSPPPGT